MTIRKAPVALVLFAALALPRAVTAQADAEVEGTAAP